MSGGANLRIWPAITAILLAIGCTAFGGRIIYVDIDAIGTNDGSSWQNAYTFLRDALATAGLPDVEEPVEIRVAQGTYRPNQGLIPIVAPGTPGRGGPSPGVWPADEGSSATFSLINGWVIKGGYAGLGEPDPNVRDVELYETVLSGDLNGDDIEVDDLSYLLDEPTRSDNSMRVITSAYNDANAVIDGFTVTGGQDLAWADPGPSGGGGMIIGNGNPTIIECTFTCNSTRQYGGGILILSGSPTLINCKFIKNYARYGAGIHNGRIFGGPFGPPERQETGNPTVINCKFVNNYAFFSGGGMDNYGGNTKLFNCIFSQNFAQNNGGGFSGGSDVVLENCIFTQNIAGYGGGISCGGNLRLTNCTFSSNSASSYGGAVESGGADIVLTNCIFSGNSAGLSGGGLATHEHERLVLNNCILAGNKVFGEQPHLDKGGGCDLFGDETTMNNCTFYGNWANQGRAISKYGSSVLRVSNCILWDGGEEVVKGSPSTLAVAYSDVEGGWEGEGNIDVDPLFAQRGSWADANDTNIIAEPNDPNAVWIEGDYHLKSQAGRFDPNSGSWPCSESGAGWVKDDVSSPCIDAGNPMSPIGHEPFPNGGVINMGAYGGTAEASKSYFGKPVCETIVAGDINGDCKVDYKDFVLLATHWLEDSNP